MLRYLTVIVLGTSAAGVVAQAQTNATNVYNVLAWSSVFNQTVYGSNGQPVGQLSKAVPNVYAYAPTIPLSAVSTTPLLTGSFQVDTSIIRVNDALNTNIATALSVIPLASPASGVIFQTDPQTGVDLPASSTLGPVFVERAETIGRHKWYLGVTHQNFHFTSFNGQSLNGLQVLYPGGTTSGIQYNGAGLTSYPATFNIGMDVRLEQDVAFVTYGVTDRLDVSVGIPLIHSAVAARTYNGILYDGLGNGTQSSTNPNCWCAGTFNPGALVSPAVNFTEPVIGQASLGKTGIGDVLTRVKGTVVQNARLAVALGADLRFATGDAQNYLGTGATSVKPFASVALYTQPLAHGIVFAPHLNVGWQFSGKSVLGGPLQADNTLTATMSDGSGQLTYSGAPFTATKGYLPDVFSWAVGSEIAFGRHNTIVVDILGNQIGWVHGVPSLFDDTTPLPGFVPTAGITNTPTGFEPRLNNAGNPVTTSYGQYNGAFGYKARLIGNLVFTFNALVRFDNNGLTARFTPLYGLGYSF